MDEVQGEEETDGEEEPEYDDAECEDAKELEGVLCSFAVHAACWAVLQVCTVIGMRTKAM